MKIRSKILAGLVMAMAVGVVQAENIYKIANSDGSTTYTNSPITPDIAEKIKTKGQVILFDRTSYISSNETSGSINETENVVTDSESTKKIVKNKHLSINCKKIQDRIGEIDYTLKITTNSSKVNRLIHEKQDLHLKLNEC